MERFFKKPNGVVIQVIPAHDIKSLEEQLPMGRLGTVQEIGNFVKSIIENNIKYLNGVTINFDGGHSNFIF